MDRQEVLQKLAQIEAHATSALSEFPQLGKERLRMILALARYLQSESTVENSPGVSEAALRPQGDDAKAGKG